MRADPLDSYHPHNPPPERPDEWLRDCWLIEIMPPTWAWAYRHLLNNGEPGRGPDSRLG